MGTAAPEPTLNRLRRTLAEIDPSNAPQLREEGRVVPLGVEGPDTALAGGLACGALHELAPRAPIHLAATTGFALALAARNFARKARGETLWIATDYARSEGGCPYGPGLDLYGLPSSRLTVLRVPRPVDALWAMEEGLRCRGLANIIVELTGDGAHADLTETRRLTLAAREGAGLGLLIRHRATPAPSAAATRWHVSAARSRPDSLGALTGGLGATAFELSLVKNRRGPSGRWTVTWDHHECAFDTPVSFALAPTALDRQDRAPSVRAG
jgi:protein ImuA